MVSLKLMSKEVDSLTTSQMSMKSQKQETERIRYLAKTYRRCRLILIERAHGYHCYGEKEVKVAGLWVHHLHYIMNGFNGMEKYILRREIIDGKHGHWYGTEMASSVYYRYRKRAYHHFLEKLSEQ